MNMKGMLMSKGSIQVNIVRYKDELYQTFNFKHDNDLRQEVYEYLKSCGTMSVIVDDVLYTSKAASFYMELKYNDLKYVGNLL